MPVLGKVIDGNLSRNRRNRRRLYALSRRSRRFMTHRSVPWIRTRLLPVCWFDPRRCLVRRPGEAIRNSNSHLLRADDVFELELAASPPCWAPSSRSRRGIERKRRVRRASAGYSLAPPLPIRPSWQGVKWTCATLATSRAETSARTALAKSVRRVGQAAEGAKCPQKNSQNFILHFSTGFGTR